MIEQYEVRGRHRSGCPVIHLNTVIDRPVGEWMTDLNALREAHPIYWNELGNTGS